VTVSVVVPTVTVALSVPCVTPVTNCVPVVKLPVATVVALEATLATVFSASVHGVIVPFDSAGVNV
jgi:hypothetical protein